MNKRNFKGWLYLLPAMLFLGIFMVYPLIDVFIYSFEEGYNSASQTYYGTGMYNYSYVLHDPYFLQAIRNTFILVVITVPLSTLLALLISVALSSVKALKKTFPDHLLSAICNQHTGRWTGIHDSFQKTAYSDGLINLVLKLFGQGPVDFIDGPYWAKMLVLCIYTIWIVMPFKVLILTSALASVNQNYYNAARVDGTSRFRIFIRITPTDDLSHCFLSDHHWFYRCIQGLQRCSCPFWHRLKRSRHEHHRRLCLRHALRKWRRLPVLCLSSSDPAVCYCFDNHLHKPACKQKTCILLVTVKVHPLYLKGIFGQNLSQIVTYILQKAFFKHALVHRFVNNYTNRVGCGFECAGIKNAGVAGYAETFMPVQSDSQTSEWYSYFENDVLVFIKEKTWKKIPLSLQNRSILPPDGIPWETSLSTCCLPSGLWSYCFLFTGCFLPL